MPPPHYLFLFQIKTIKKESESSYQGLLRDWNTWAYGIPHENPTPKNLFTERKLEVAQQQHYATTTIYIQQQQLAQKVRS